MSVEPGPVPVTTPVVLATVATAVLLLLQVPPVVEFVRVVVAPSHTVKEPLMADGSGFTTNVVVLVHPALMWYVIVAVPAVTPVTSPVPVLTVAIAVLLLLHVPPDVACDKVDEEPTQVFVVPVIADGAPFTVAIVVTLHPPGAV